MNDLLYKALLASQQGRSYAFATIIESTVKGTPQKIGAKMVVLEDGTLWGTIGGGRNEKAAKELCLQSLQSGKPCVVTYDYFGGVDRSVCGGRIKVFIEPFIGIKKLIICGAGHIALPLSILGKMLQFNVAIIDNRSELLNKDRFLHVDQLILGEHDQCLEEQAMDQNTYVMIVTQGNEFDYKCLRGVISKNFGYLGVISSLAKRIKFIKRLKDDGISENLIRRINIPAGIDLGAQTPEEIAVSIIAEVIKHKCRDHLNSSKFKIKSEVGLNDAK